MSFSSKIPLAFGAVNKSWDFAQNVTARSIKPFCVTSLFLQTPEVNHLPFKSGSTSGLFLFYFIIFFNEATLTPARMGSQGDFSVGRNPTRNFKNSSKKTQNKTLQVSSHSSNTSFFSTVRLVNARKNVPLVWQYCRSFCLISCKSF